MSLAQERPDAPPRPSVFISYASEDRPAARCLRDALAAAGLDVWYDENELGGGDAWDQKLRGQIRDCEYFMPLISATTERRKEGYFRREWRLAAERTMDMADDVLFLLPVTIDDTSETAARVPDKFRTVQWLHLPGGQPTPAFAALCRRLVAGEHHILPPPLPRARQAQRRSATIAPIGRERSHFPSFPAVPESGGAWRAVKFIIEIFAWLLGVAGAFLQRLPRWCRVVLVVWLGILLISRLGRQDSPPDPHRPRPGPGAKGGRARDALKQAAEEFAAGRQAGKTGAGDFDKIGENIGRTIAAIFDGKPLTVIPFESAVADPADRELVRAIFAACYGELVVARGAEIGLSPEPAAGLDEKALQARGQARGSNFVLHANVGGGDAAHTLVVRMIRVSDGTVAWTGSYPLAGTSPVTVAGQIAEGVLAALPKP